MSQIQVPYIPDSAPFSSEQRSWLNGYLAGMFARAPFAAPDGAELPTATQTSTPLTILYGSQTGNAETLARQTSKAAAVKGFTPKVVDMQDYSPSELAGEENLLVITSTYGDGDPPDNAVDLWETLAAAGAPVLEKVKYSVLALGDSNYAEFCQCGKNFDQRLEELGGQRIHPRVDCDVEFDEAYADWLDGVLATLQANTPLGQSESAIHVRNRVPSGEKEESVSSPFSRKNPFPGQLLVNAPLNGSGSIKETCHFEVSLTGSGLAYKVGDAVGILPSNCPELVDEIITVLGCGDQAPVPIPMDRTVSLGEALLEHYDLRNISRDFLQAVLEWTKDDDLTALLQSDDRQSLDAYLYGREVVDFLIQFPQLEFSAVEFVGLLKNLQPRLYSISSSLKAHPDQIHMTVGVVRYESHGRRRKGVCSSYLADRCRDNRTVNLYFSPNRNFRLPGDAQTPVIMIGPGTGIAPFRAFLQERRANGGSGRNWLFFGNPHSRTDFLYKEEMEEYFSDGLLTRLDTAFSRDQEKKVYVQHRMLDRARDIYGWLEEGACIYVCGDANRMAGDVDRALHQIVATEGDRSEADAAAYVKALKKEKRYLRDVY